MEQIQEKTKFISNLKSQIINLKKEYKFIIIIIMILIIFLIYKYFKNTSNQCIFINMDGCGFCKKQKDLLNLNNNKLNNISVKIIDSNTPEAQNLITKHNIDAFPVLIMNDKVSLGFKDLQEHFTQLTTNDIIFIGNDSCPYCKKMKTLLDTNKTKYDFIDSNSQEGQNHMSKSKSNGVPLLYSRDNNKYLTGYDENYNKILNSPSVPVILVGTPKCPHCVKMKNLFDSTFGSSNYNLIDSETQEGIKLMEKHSSKSVPLCINTVTNKNIIGYSDNIINELMSDSNEKQQPSNPQQIIPQQQQQQQIIPQQQQQQQQIIPHQQQIIPQPSNPHQQQIIPQPSNPQQNN